MEHDKVLEGLHVVKCASINQGIHINLKTILRTIAKGLGEGGCIRDTYVCCVFILITYYVVVISPGYKCFRFVHFGSSCVTELNKEIIYFGTLR